MLWGSTIPVLAQYNPDNPAEPDFPAEELVQYKVTLAANIPEAGTLTGAGKYKFGTNVTVKATENAGYKLRYWTLNDATEAYSTSLSFTYNVTAADVKLTAVYEKQKTLTLTQNDERAGRVTGAGLYLSGQEVTLTATANPFYTFLRWEKDGEVYSADATTTYTVGDEDVTLQAVYDCPTSVTVVANNPSMGSVSYAYAYNIISSTLENKDVTIGTGTSGSNTLPFGNYYKYSTTESIYTPAEVGGAGKIYSLAYYVSAATTFSCSVNIYMGHKSSSTFSSASDCVPYSGLTLVYSNSSTSIGRATGWETYQLSTPFEYNGTDNLVIVVTKSAGSYTNSLNYRYTTASDKCLYRQNDNTTSYATASSTSGFSLSSNRPDVKFNMDIGSIVYGTDLVAHVKAKAATKYMLLYWLRNDETTPYSTEEEFDYDLSEPASFKAVFGWNPDNPAEPDDFSTKLKYRVKVSISDEEAGLVTGAGSYMYGTSATISTSPTLGYEFLSWTKKAPSGDVEEFSRNKSFSYTIAAEDVEFVANYQWVGIPEPVDPDAGKHHLNLVAEPLGSCTFNRTNGELIADGLTYSVTATKGNADYVFKGWKLNGSLLPGESLTYSSIMGSEDITLTAVFEYNPDSPAEPEEDIYVEEAQTKGIKGDVNGDESVDTTDAIIVLNYYLGKTLDINKNAADVNEDKEIDTTDYILIINKYLNK